MRIKEGNSGERIPLFLLAISGKNEYTRIRIINGKKRMQEMCGAYEKKIKITSVNAAGDIAPGIDIWNMYYYLQCPPDREFSIPGSGVWS